MLRKHKLRTVLAAPLIAVALLLSACIATPVPDTPTTAASLSHFYEQDLQFESCEDYSVTELQEKTFDAVTRAECARLTVPINYDHPGDGTTELAVTRMAASGDAKGSVIVNSGGPGGSGQLQAIIAASGLKDTPITEQYDIVGVDPRGVSASSPAIDCISQDGIRHAHVVRDDAADEALGMLEVPGDGEPGEWKPEPCHAAGKQLRESTFPHML